MSKGQTYYVNHITMSPGVGMVTKETPNNEKTKAAFKAKGILTIVTYENGTREALIN